MPAPDAVIGDAAPHTLDPSHCDVTTDRDQAVVGVDTIAITVTVRDGDNHPMVGVTVELGVTGTGNTVGTPALTNSNGATTVTLTSTVAESKDITARVATTPIGSHTVTFVPKPATHLVFLDPPGDVEAGAAFAPAIRVLAEDVDGNAVPTAIGAVTLELAANPGNAQLGGTTSVALTNGTATFADLHIDTPATAYTIRASSAGLTEVTSAPFDVTAGLPDAAHTTLDASPPSLEADGIATTTVTAHVANQHGAPVANVPVDFTITGSGNAMGPTHAVTTASGAAVATLSSTVSEVKTITATLPALAMTVQVHFYPPGCQPRLPGAPWSTLAVPPDALLVTDIDGDGHQDAIISEAGQDVAIYRGRGNGLFFPPFLLPSTLRANAIAAGDVDGDGTLDLVIAAGDGSGRILIARGTGAGQFVTLGTVLINDVAQQLVLGDFDRNGTMDIAVNLPGRSEIQIELGRGDGTFSDGATISNIAVLDLATADVNRDGNLDLLGDDSRYIYAALGTGTGTFGTPLNSQEELGGGPLYIGDLDGDGILDALTTGSDMVGVVLGRGDGRFNPRSTYVLLASNLFTNPAWSPVDSASLTDLDNDGDLDVVIESGSTVSILTNDGIGFFTLERAYLGGSRMAYVDVDEDGIDDVLALGPRSFGVLRGDTVGHFATPVIDERPRGMLYPATADVDGNGQLDLIRAEENFGYVVGLTQPDGSIHDADPSGAVGADSLVFADVTGDGLTDLVTIDSTTLTTAPGLGDGRFTIPWITQTILAGRTLTAATFGPDHQADLVMTERFSNGFSIALAQSDNHFAPPQSYASTTNWVVVGDVNADGFSDILTEDATALYVYLGNGLGGVSAPAMYPTHGWQGEVSLADVDGDSLLDVLILATNPTTNVTSIVVLRGLGAGTFGSPLVTPAIAFPTGTQVQGLHAGELTGDRKLDVVASTDRGLAIVEGFGDGYFRQHPWFYGFAEHSGGPVPPTVLVTDRNRDGISDLTFAALGGLAIAINRGCAP